MAVLCCALLSLATARGIIPGLCANQTAEVTVVALYGADSVLSPVSECCVTRLRALAGAPGNDTLPLQPEQSCAFCTLAKALVEPLEQVRLPLPDTHVAAAPALRPETLHADWNPSAATLRGPPRPLVQNV